MAEVGGVDEDLRDKISSVMSFCFPGVTCHWRCAFESETDSRRPCTVDGCFDALSRAHLKNLPDEIGDVGERKGDNALGDCGSDRPEIGSESPN